MEYLRVTSCDIGKIIQKEQEHQGNVTIEIISNVLYVMMKL
jgi:hypothetical protein